MGFLTTLNQIAVVAVQIPNAADNLKRYKFEDEK
jgi:hypothetical protein